jgi:hypothetical protein
VKLNLTDYGLAYVEGPVVPKKIYYVFGLDKEFIKKPFSFYNYLCILSAKIVNPTYQITVFYKYRPPTFYFDELESFCELIQLDEKSPLTKEQNLSLDKINFSYYEHRCDLMRLYILYNYGGIYLDVDVVCTKPFDTLLSHKMVMGEEYARYKNIPYYKVLIGLCNAVIMCEPNNQFIKKWIDEYFIEYKQNWWDYNCIQVPRLIAKKHPSLINIQPQNSFFKFSYDCEGYLNLLEYNSDISDCYCIHLWTSMFGKYLNKYDEKYILTNSDTLSNIFKRLLPLQP